MKNNIIYINFPLERKKRLFLSMIKKLFSKKPKKICKKHLSGKAIVKYYNFDSKHIL